MKTTLVERFADSPRRVRIMFRIAMITILAAGCYNWMIQPQTSYLFAARQRGRWDAKKSEQLEKLDLSIQEFKKQISQAEAQSQQVHKVLFEPNAVRDFFCGLEVLARESGCRIESLAFIDTEGPSGQKQPQDAIVGAVGASVVVIGNYSTLTHFFEQVGRCPKKISIHELRFEPLTQGKSTLRCNVTITVYVSNKAVAGKQ
jgi:Tfp pilus assembly protein PilO